MASLSLSPVAEAVYGRLNVAAVTDFATGGVHEDIPQAPTFPFVFFEVEEERDERGFGTGGLPLVRLRAHVYSEYEGARQAHLVMQQVIARLKDASLTVTGYDHAGQVFYDQTVVLADEQIHGVRVREMVAQFRIYVEES